MRTSWRERSPTNTRGLSNAARTKRSGPENPPRTTRCSLVLPAERDFIQALGAELFRRARDRAAAESAIEADRRFIVGERPDDETFQTALRQITPRRGEQAAA